MQLRVIDIDDDGNIRVDFHGNQFIFQPDDAAMAAEIERKWEERGIHEELYITATLTQ